MAKDDKKGKKGAADAKGKGGKGKKGKGGKGAASANDRTSVAGHPRAAAQVRMAKGWGGIGAFVIAAYLAHSAHVPADQVGLRALAAGVAGYVLAWACSVAVWRHLVMAEMRTLVESGRMAVERKPPGAAAGKADGARSDG